MNISDVLKKAILSEKAYKQMEKGIYTFLVNERSTKEQVSRAVKSQFNVDATRVNIARVAHKAKRIGTTRKQTLVGGGKKAIVQLKSGQSIPMLSPKTESKKGQKSKKAEGPERSRREKDTQTTTAEGKEG